VGELNGRRLAGTKRFGTCCVIHDDIFTMERSTSDFFSTSELVATAFSQPLSLVWIPNETLCFKYLNTFVVHAASQSIQSLYLFLIFII
jgi:hypothetical protein